MEDYDREQQQEMFKQVQRYENFKRTGEKTWFDSDNYVDIIDWYTINDMYYKVESVVIEAYSLFPDNEEVISRYTSYLASKGEYEKAILITKQAIEKNKTDDLLIDLASLYIDSGEHFDDALPLLLDVVKRDSDNYFNFFLIGRIYLEKEDFINAEKYLHKALELNYEDKMLLGCYSDCAFEPSLQQEIITLLYNLAHEHPFNDNLWTTLGIAYSRYNFTDEAIEAFDLAIAIKPEGEIRHSCKADCLIAKNDYIGAKNELELALKYSPNDAVELHIVLAGILMKENDYAQAIIHLRHADEKKQDLTDKTYLLDLALCYYHINQPNKAITIIQQALTENIASELIVDFARRVYDNGFEAQSEDIFEMIITNNTDAYTVELASVTLAALKSREGNTFEAVKIMEHTLEELNTCTEDFWYAFLRITCQDKMYDNYTLKTLKVLMALKSFPQYIKEHYPEIFDNPNYNRCLKQIYHV